MVMWDDTENGLFVLRRKLIKKTFLHRRGQNNKKKKSSRLRNIRSAVRIHQWEFTVVHGSDVRLWRESPEARLPELGHVTCDL